MARLISAAMKRVLDAHYTSALQDTCQVMDYPGATTGTYGYGKPTYTEGEILPCLFRPSSKGGVIGGFGAGSNELLGSAQVETADAVFFLPRNADVDALDRLKLLTLMGETITPIVYEIVGGPVLDQVEKRCTVRQVNDGSDE